MKINSMPSFLKTQSFSSRLSKRSGRPARYERESQIMGQRRDATGNVNRNVKKERSIFIKRPRGDVETQSQEVNIKSIRDRLGGIFGKAKSRSSKGLIDQNHHYAARSKNRSTTFASPPELDGILFDTQNSGGSMLAGNLTDSITPYSSKDKAALNQILSGK